MSSSLRKKTLFLSLDAFGTIFHPRRPIVQQYAEVGGEYGFKDISSAELQQSFKNAFKEQSKKNPNYGKATGMNAEQWWENIIKSTFHPYLNREGAPKEVSPEMIQKLLHRFSSKEGYAIFLDAKRLFSTLRMVKESRSETAEWPWARTIVNVTSNSDARIKSVLESLQVTIGQSADISNVTLSYDTGYEKPDARMFEVAAMNASEGAVRLHVGDDLEKDALAAMMAGGDWHGVFIDRERQLEEWKSDQADCGVLKIKRNGHWITGIDSLDSLRHWRPDEH